MNNPHKGARLTVYSREQIVARIQAGTKSAEVAAAFGVSLRTVRKCRVVLKPETARAGGHS